MRSTIVLVAVGGPVLASKPTTLERFANDWRLNGFGDFAGMIAGLASALGLFGVPGVKLSIAFPALSSVSTVGTAAGSLLTKPEEKSVLVGFYVCTRRWGGWGPIHRAAVRHPQANLVRPTAERLKAARWQPIAHQNLSESKAHPD